MWILGRFRKQRAIKSYINKLPLLLAKDYGSSKRYKPQQIRSTIMRSNLDDFYSCYAISMFSNREDFEQFHLENGEPCDYDIMRGEVIERHFDNNLNFNFFNIFHHETGTDHTSSHDSSDSHNFGDH